MYVTTAIQYNIIISLHSVYILRMYVDANLSNAHIWYALILYTQIKFVFTESQLILYS